MKTKQIAKAVSKSANSQFNICIVLKVQNLQKDLDLEKIKFK